MNWKKRKNVSLAFVLVLMFACILRYERQSGAQENSQRLRTGSVSSYSRSLIGRHTATDNHVETQIVPCTPPPAGLVAFYRAENNAFDSIGNNRGTVLGNIGYTNGFVGKAFNFIGGGRISTPLDVQVNTMPNSTWVAWVKVIPQPDGFLGGSLFSNTDGGADRQWLYFGKPPFSPGAGFVVRNDNSGTCCLPLPVANQWSFIAQRFHSGQLSTFQDGTISTYPLFQIEAGTTVNKFTIGGNPDGTRLWTGAVDDIAIFNRELNIQEISDIYDFYLSGQGNNICLRTISGKVSKNNLPLSGVLMTLAGSSADVTITDVDGNYIFNNLTEGGNYSVTPFLPGSTFTPTNDIVSNLTTPQILDFTVSQTDINLPVHRWSQGGTELWAGNTYDHHVGKAIKDIGCALTSLAMALRFASVMTLPDGAELNPGSLNDWMNGQAADYNDKHDVNFINSARDASPNVTWNNLDRTATANDVLDVLRQGYPVIVAVTKPTPKGGTHFVLITGVQEDGVFRIQDPGNVDIKTLAYYGNQFSARGYVARLLPLNPLNSSASVLSKQSSSSQSLDRSALSFSVGDTVNILVVDQAGRRTGVDPTTGQIFQEIPKSYYYVDSLSDDVTDGPTTETDYSVNISTPAQGSYTVVLSGQTSGEFGLRTGIYSKDGSAQPPILVTGKTAVGLTSTFVIPFNSTPSPMLFTAEGSSNLAALDSVMFLRDPFSVLTTQNFSSDHRTRIALFSANVDLMPGESVSVVTAQAEDAQHHVYTLPVEYVGKAPKLSWITQIVVKLPDELSAGDVLVSISLRGVTSNRALIKIKN